MKPKVIPKHGGYRNLKSYQNSELIYDLTVEFCRRYIQPNRTDRTDRTDRFYASYKSYRTADQMVQAARSGKQNIAEGSQTSATSKKSEFRLTSVARASFEELLQDYEDFLRQNSLNKWDKDDERVQQIRQLVYKTNKADRTNKSYMSYIDDAERAANMLITLISQTNYLLDQQLRALEKDVSLSVNELAKIRLNEQDEIKNDIKEMTKEFGLTQLQSGEMITNEEYEKRKASGEDIKLFGE